MLRTALTSLALTLIFAVPLAATETAPELELARAWSVEGPGRFDASGIVVRDGEFFVVTDRHGDTIFRLRFEGDVARAEAFLTFTGPDPYPWIGYMDLEGIALAPDGGFFLAPEWGFAICRVPAGGGRAEWVTPNVKAAGEATGLFATKDAFVEGVAVLGDGHVLIACERAPRGLVEVYGGVEATRVAAQRMESSRFGVAAERGLDWSDLAVWRGRVFALARNQHLVVELERGEGGAWAEKAAWSFARTENAPAYSFTDMRYGQAEGLVVTDEAIHVMIDNNNLERAGHPGDRRTWLFSFRNVIPR